MKDTLDRIESLADQLHAENWRERRRQAGLRLLFVVGTDELRPARPESPPVRLAEVLPFDRRTS